MIKHNDSVFKRNVIYRLLKPTVLEKLIIRLLIPNNCFVLQDTNKYEITQIIFLKDLKLDYTFNKVVFQKYKEHPPGLTTSYTDISFKECITEIISRMSDRFIEPESIIDLKKQRDKYFANKRTQPQRF